MNKRNLFSIIVPIQISILIYPFLKSTNNIFSEIYIISDILFVVLALLMFVVVPGLILTSLISLGTEEHKRLLYALPIGLLFLYTTLFLWEIFVPTFSKYRPLSHMSLVMYTLTLSISINTVLCKYKKARGWVGEYNRVSFTPGIKLSVIVIILGFTGWWWLQKFNTDIVVKSLLITIVFMPLYVVRGNERRSNIPILIMSAMFALVISSELLYPINGSFSTPYNFISDVMSTGDWMPSIPHRHNNILSTILVIPFITNLLHVSIKSSLFFYYIIYATVPVYYYIIAREFEIQQTYSFFGAYLIFTFPLVTYNFGGIVRQVASLAFLGALALAIVDTGPSRRNSYTLMSVFMIGIALSHYATIYLILVPVTGGIFYYFGISLLHPQNRNGAAGNLLLVLVLGSVFTISWHTFVSSSRLMIQIAIIVELIFSHLGGILETQTQGAKYATSDRHLPFVIFRILNLLVVLFVGMSAISMSMRDITDDLRTGRIVYVGTCYGFILLLGLSIIVPYFAGFTSIDFPRLYSISLFIFAPVFSYGLSMVANQSLIQNKLAGFNVIVVVFLMTTMMFGSGLVFDYSQKAPNPATHLMYDDEELSIQEQIRVNSETFTKKDISGAKFLSKHGKYNIEIYSDWYSGTVLLVTFGGFDSRWITDRIESEEAESLVIRKPTTVPAGSYVFLSTYNTENGMLLNRLPEQPTPTQEYLPKIDRYNKIYSNNGTTIKYS